MENNSSQLSTDSLEDDDFLADPTTILWRWVWPLLCVSGLVGNTLVLLVLRRDGFVRTSANVYLTVLAAGDSLVLMMATVMVYPGIAWGFWVEDSSIWTCRANWLVFNTLLSASIWVIVAFTAERCVAVRCPLLKLRLCTPNKAGLCCVALLVVAFVKNIDLLFVLDLTTDSMGDVTCHVPLHYQTYVIHYRTWISFVLTTAGPIFIVLVSNWIIIRQVRQTLMRTTAQDSLTRSTLMCLGVSFAFVVCVVPYGVFFVIDHYLPVTPQTRDICISSLTLLRYVNHAINFFMYSLTGANFRSELVALIFNCTQRVRSAAAVVPRTIFRVAGRFEFRPRTGND